MSWGTALVALVGAVAFDKGVAVKLPLMVIADADRAKPADDPRLPTRVYPLYVKVECLPGMKTAPRPDRPGKKGLHDYDFRSTSPDEFVTGLEAVVSGARRNFGAVAENRGKFNVQCAIKLLVIEGEVKSGLGGSVTTGTILSDNQTGRLQELMAPDATIFWAACMSMTKNGTTQTLQKVLGKKGGVFVGFKSYCLDGCTFPNQLGQDEVYPAALRIKKCATADDLKELFALAGLPVKGDERYYRDTRFPGETDTVTRAFYEVADPCAFANRKDVKKPSVEELIGKPVVIPARKD